LLNWSAEPSLQSITCPVLIVASEYDYYPLDGTKAYMTKLNNAQLVVIEGAHHAVTLEKPMAFNRVLMDYLRLQHSTELPSAMGVDV
jgi:3-oxoadipate enol-lactonase